MDPQVFEGRLHIRFEQLYGFGRTAGVDEAGRGPWAGPVVAAAVILFPSFLSLPFASQIDDSKRLSSSKREAIVTAIETLEAPSSEDSAPLFWAVGQASPIEIDTLNIREANFLAMRRALDALPVFPSTILLDGTGGLQVPASVIPVVKGDQQILSIATASLLAKVTRDRLMDQLAEDYPLYDWQNNKGYGTRSHQEALQRHGPTPHHRLSFKPIKALASQERPLEKLETFLSPH